MEKWKRSQEFCKHKQRRCEKEKGMRMKDMKKERKIEKERVEVRQRERNKGRQIGREKLAQKYDNNVVCRVKVYMHEGIFDKEIAKKDRRKEYKKKSRVEQKRTLLSLALKNRKVYKQQKRNILFFPKVYTFVTGKNEKKRIGFSVHYSVNVRPVRFIRDLSKRLGPLANVRSPGTSKK